MSVENLRAALADWANSDPIPPVKGFGPVECWKVFAAAGIDVPEECRSAVEIVFKRLPFYGGNFTLDAKRLLRAATPQPGAVGPER